MIHDLIVVGSGATGSMAAQTLVEAGAKVLMLDVGNSDEFYRHRIPLKDFVSIRREETEQHAYFLGREFEGIPWGKIRVGSQLTPPRQHLLKDVERFLRVESDSFFPMESLGYGGLGAAWGLGCHAFSEVELAKAGLDPGEIQPAYELIAARIGICGTQDDATPYCLGGIRNYLPVFDLEEPQQGILHTYEKKKGRLNARGFFLGRSALAVLTRPLHGRGAASFTDMDYWSDNEQSAYRSWMTVDELKRKENFIYQPNCLVLRFADRDTGVEVFVTRTDTGEKLVFQCQKLILAPGVLGTARIVMRSLGHDGERLPLICNPFRYMPCLRLQNLGIEPPRLKSSVAQLVMFHDALRNNVDAGMAAMFTYRSLLLFRLIKETPLNFRDGRAILHRLQPAIVIVGIHHPEDPSASKYVQLKPDSDSPTGDVLSARYVLSDEERLKVNERMREWRWAFRRLGCIPLKTVDPGHGASLHYAGCLPFSEQEQKFHLHPDGRLYGTRRVFVADGSGFRHLPAKGVTLTLMANAHLVAKKALSA